MDYLEAVSVGPRGLVFYMAIVSVWSTTWLCSAGSRSENDVSARASVGVCFSVEVMVLFQRVWTKDERFNYDTASSLIDMIERLLVLGPRGFFMLMPHGECSPRGCAFDVHAEFANELLTFTLKVSLGTMAK